MTESFTCPGCRGITGDAVSMERHEQSCILALRQRVNKLETRIVTEEEWTSCLGDHLAALEALTERVMEQDARIRSLEGERQERIEAEEARELREDLAAGYATERRERAERFARERQQELEDRIRRVELDAWEAEQKARRAW